MDQKKQMNVWWAVLILAVFAGLIFISVKDSKDKYMNDAENGRVGEVEAAKAGDIVAMAYTGRLSDGTVFDSNIDPKFGHMEPFIFELGAGQVIPGWDKAILGMKAGEKKTITVPPEEGYGARGVPGVIPPNATLIFEVEVLAIKSK